MCFKKTSPEKTIEIDSASVPLIPNDYQIQVEKMLTDISTDNQAEEGNIFCNLRNYITWCWPSALLRVGRQLMTLR